MQSPRQEIQKLFKQTFEASIKTLCRKWKEKLFPNDYSILGCLQNAKTNTIMKI